jgi:hypothetical protein
MYVVGASQVRAEMRTQAEMDGIIRIIAKRYAPVLRSGAMAMLGAFNISAAICAPECANVIIKMFANPRQLSRSVVSTPIIGDLFHHENHVLALQPHGHMLTAWEISQHSASPHLPDFCAAVSEAARISIDGRRLRGMDFDWTRLGPPQLSSSYSAGSRNLTRPMSELVTKAAEISEDIVSDASLLVNRDRRDFLRRLAQLGRARSSDAQADVETGHVALLIDRGLVQKEYLVLCRKDSHTLCSVDSMDQLSAEVHCPICGRLFSDELVQEIYAPTDRARAMLDGSHWMTVWVTSVLVACGIPPEQILWGATAGEDEIDIIAKVGNESIFFELKDRMFGLGDAYPFTARVQRYGASAGVIISMDGIAQEVERFLTEQARGQVIYQISGDKEVKTKIPSMLTERAKVSAISTIREVFMPAGIDPTPVLSVWSRKRRVVRRSYAP